jgi:iron complex transport system ATP-binding protein
VTPALAATALHVRLGTRDVLHDLDLAIPQGRWTAVVGPNGAGKTTLLKALALLVPSSGELELLGRDARSFTRRERAQALAWLGQAEGGAEDMRAHDVVMLGRVPRQGWLASPSREDEQRVQDAMRSTQCWEWRERPLAELSGGERQRVLLARALAVGAPVLLMDEPLANLDPPHQADWQALVRRHVAGGGTVVSVLHELTMALQADDLLVIAGGRIAHHGATADPHTQQALHDVFGRRVRVHEVAGRRIALTEP